MIPAIVRVDLCDSGHCQGGCMCDFCHFQSVSMVSVIISMDSCNFGVISMIYHLL